MSRTPLTTSGDICAWSAAAAPLHAAHDVLLLDLDGVVYVGPDAVPGAPTFLADIRTAGARLAFVTNNAARSAATVAEHLTDLGVPAAPDDVVTSAQAAASVLGGQLPNGARVLVIGGDGLREAVVAEGLTPVFSADEAPAAVVQGFAPTVGWSLLLEACVAVRSGVPWVATNPDLTLPTPRGPAPGNGALVEVVRRTTGVEPLVVGKPFRPLLDEAARRTGARRPLVVGDRLDTDIAGAHAAGLPSLLVLTGISGVGDLLAAEATQRPTYIWVDLGGLSTAHPGCSPDGEGWRCGSVWARATGQRLDVVPTGPVSGTPDEALQAVRAVSSAAWSNGQVTPRHGLDALAAWTAPHGLDR